MIKYLEKAWVKVSFWFWVLTRPKSVRRTAWRYPPWYPYLIIPTGQKAWIVSYFEDGTTRVRIYDDPELGDYEVFGYGPKDLVRLDST